MLVSWYSFSVEYQDIVRCVSIFHDCALLTTGNFRKLNIAYDGTTATKSSVNALEHERKWERDQICLSFTFELTDFRWPV